MQVTQHSYTNGRLNVCILERSGVQCPIFRFYILLWLTIQREKAARQPEGGGVSVSNKCFQYYNLSEEKRTWFKIAFDDVLEYYLLRRKGWEIVKLCCPRKIPNFSNLFLTFSHQGINITPSSRSQANAGDYLDSYITIVLTLIKK